MGGTYRKKKRTRGEGVQILTHERGVRKKSLKRVKKKKKLSITGSNVPSDKLPGHPRGAGVLLLLLHLGGGRGTIFKG